MFLRELTGAPISGSRLLNFRLCFRSVVLSKVLPVVLPVVNPARPVDWEKDIRDGGVVVLGVSWDGGEESWPARSKSEKSLFLQLVSYINHC